MGGGFSLVVGQFEFSSPKITKPPTRKTQAPAKAIQLPATILPCLSAWDKWAREAGGFSRTLQPRSLALSQDQLSAPMRQTKTGNLTTIGVVPLNNAGAQMFRKFKLTHYLFFHSLQLCPSEIL
jgi:hypothetical protein